MPIAAPAGVEADLDRPHQPRVGLDGADQAEPARHPLDGEARRGPGTATRSGSSGANHSRWPPTSSYRP